MILVHYLENSRAHRILWLLEELGLPYEIMSYRRGPDMRAPAELKRVHPLGKSPVIEDGGRIIAESGAIIEYLLDHHGATSGLRPQPDEDGGDARLRYNYWLHYAEGSAMPLLVMKLIASRLPSQVPLLVRPVAQLIARGLQDRLTDPQLTEHMGFWETELSRDGWFAGRSFTAADIAMSFPVEAGLSRFKMKGEMPAISRYVAAIRARPAYQQALSRGGAYVYAKS